MPSDTFCVSRPQFDFPHAATAAATRAVRPAAPSDLPAAAAGAVRAAAFLRPAVAAAAGLPAAAGTRGSAAVPERAAAAAGAAAAGNDGVENLYGDRVKGTIFMVVWFGFLLVLIYIAWTTMEGIGAVTLTGFGVKMITAPNESFIAFDKRSFQMTFERKYVLPPVPQLQARHPVHKLHWRREGRN